MNVAALEPDREQRTKRYVELYNRLARLNQADVARRYWVLPDQAKVKKELVTAFWRSRPDLLEVVKRNLSAGARPEQGNPLELLEPVAGNEDGK